MYVVVNARSGGAGGEQAAERIGELLRARGMDACVDVARTPVELAAANERAVESDADLIVAAGGDGTIAGLAAPLLESGRTLGVVPLGTFNYFAQNMGVPLDLEGAIDVLATGAPGPVTVGEVNGRVFLNNSSIGLHPKLLRKREDTYRLTGRNRVAAAVSAGIVLCQRPPMLDLDLVCDGTRLTRRTTLLFVGANLHQLEPFDVPGRECVANDRLIVYVAPPLPAPRLWTLAARALVRGVRDIDALEVMCAREVIVTPRRRRTRIALDGEVVKTGVPLRFRARERALAVMMPNHRRARLDPPAH